MVAVSKPRAGCIMGGVVILGLVVAAYWPALQAGFVWDDDAMLTRNAAIQSGQGLFWIWRSAALPDYFPLTATSLWLEWRLWGSHAGGYHLTNLLLHAASTILLWRVLRRLAVPAAWLVAALFAVHPVNVESVAWISERKNTLAMLFYVLTLYSWARWRGYGSEGPQENQRGRTRLGWYVVSLTCFLLALLSKTAVVMLPFALLLIVWWKDGRLRRRDILESAPWFGLSLVLGVVTLWFQHHRAIAGDFVQSGGFVRRVAGAVVAFWFYLYKAVLPINLSFVYPQWELRGSVVLAMALTLAAMVMLWRWRSSWGRHGAFGLAYFGLMVLPVLGFVDVYFHRYSLVADHWQYFSIVSVLALAVAGVVMVGSLETVKTVSNARAAGHTPLKRGVNESRGGARQGKSDPVEKRSHGTGPSRKASLSIWNGIVPGRPAVVWFGILSLAMCSVLTFHQAGTYRDAETLWQHTLKRNPRAWLALNNLGQIYASKGRIDDAMELYAAALRAKPEQVEAHNNLGAVLMDLGRLDQAEEQFKAALAVNPRFAMAYYNLGNVADRRGDGARATALFRRALELDPEYADANNNLGCMLAAEGNINEALDHFRAALRWKPDYPDACNNLGSTLTQAGRPAEARPFLEKALQINPNYADAHHNLGNALLAVGQRTEAMAEYKTALELNPNLHEARVKLGGLYLEDRQWDEALREFSIIAQIHPQSPEIHYQLGVVLRAKKQTAAAIEQYQTALRLNPDLVQAINNLAWIYATHPADPIRNGAEAVRLASHAADLTNRKSAGVLDTLAAAEAEAGHFALAVSTAELAVDLAKEAGDKALPAQIEARLVSYRQHRPFRD